MSKLVQLVRERYVCVRVAEIGSGATGKLCNVMKMETFLCTCFGKYAKKANGHGRKAQMRGQIPVRKNFCSGQEPVTS